MFITSQPEQTIRYDTENKNQYGNQQKREPELKPNQLLSDLAVILRDVQAPDRTFHLQENVSVPGKTPLSRFSPENNIASENDSTNDSINLHQWFDDFNAHPEKGASKYRDTDSPYFLQPNLTNTSKDVSDVTPLPDLGFNRKGGGSDDYRSVIDDLTIENQRLRKKLRRYKKNSNSNLEKDKLFEIRIHDIPTAKRRELETTLRSFASSIDLSTRQLRGSLSSSMNQCNSTKTLDSKKKSTSTSTSNSQLEQSSYDSIMTSTLPTTIISDYFVLGTEKSASFDPSVNPSKNLGYPIRPNKRNSLLPKHGLRDMTDRQKKNLIVQRLEQIFTGEKGSIMGAPCQPITQEEKSKQQSENDFILTLSGNREAHMIPQENYSYTRPTGPMNCSKCKNSYSSDETTSEESFSNQRPTRPLELDPDRTQIPSDNVEYIRHLGLATPQLESDDSEDATREGAGWVYLNLLINMAQLHIFNVTPDFVRSAVVDVSEKFQLSKDGQMLRWKGGSQGTHLHNDDNSSSRQNSDSPKISDQDQYGSKEKEKLTYHHSKSRVSTKLQCSMSGFHYKPLFISQSSSERASNSSESPLGQSRTDESLSSHNPWNQSRSRRQQSSSTGKKQNEDGSLVFYRGVDFCVDLCGDSELNSFQLPDAIIEEDNDIEINLRLPLSTIPMERTSSGSSLQYRPFKDPNKIDTESPEVMEKSTSFCKFLSNFQHELGKFPTVSQQKAISRQPLQPCGIGGAQISDHFEICVLIQHTVTSSSASCSSSARPMKYVENIQPHIFFKTQNDIEATHVGGVENDDDIESPSTTISCVKSHFPSPPQVRTKIISTRIISLPPLRHPSPATLQYSSDSDGD